MMLIGTQPRMHFSHGPVPRRHALMQWKQSRSTVSWMTARSRGSRGGYPGLSLDEWDPSGSVVMGASGTASMPHAMPLGFDPMARAGAASHWRDPGGAPGRMAFYDGAAYDPGGYYRAANEFGAYRPGAGYGVSGVYGGMPASQNAAFHPSMHGNPAAVYGNATQWAPWEHHAAPFGGAPGYAGDPRAAYLSLIHI